MTKQHVPVNLYREADRLMVAAPLPGMEPGSVRVDVRGRLLTIDARLRGPGQNRTQRYLQREWSVGPYTRSVLLPEDVDAAAANAVYNNGVLVIILPIGGDQSDDTIRMSKVGTTRGRRVRHTGHPGQRT
ncbi:MAG: Hsp20/alpha crystallin family protein [bacterium]